MNDKQLENLFARIDDRVDKEARLRSVAAALQTFDAVQEEKKNTPASQGIVAAHRLTSEQSSIGRKIMQLNAANNPARRWLYGAMASAAVLVLGVFIALQIPTQSGLVSETATPDDSNVQAQYSMQARELFALADSSKVAAKASPGSSSLGLQAFSLPEETGPRSSFRASGRDKFDAADANPVKRVSAEPVSTFSIDVDTASYSFVRRQLNAGFLPQKAAVRLEELVNYFPYDYPLPKDRSQPFSTNVTVLDSPWKAGNKLVHIGIQGYELQEAQPRANIVFLLDVSGSMETPDKLPLVKQSMGLLLESLHAEDSVAIVVYAGAAGTVLEPTPVKDKQKILAALDRLQAGGSTAGAAGIQLAYQLAESQFIANGVNRIVLATDGDFNVGIDDIEELKGFVERKRQSGVFLSVLGFGQGNYQDALMQALAQNGNGVAAYIDTLGEAQKVLVEEASSALFPIAKDVKIQVEFNPAAVSEYRLLGYETRLLAEEDFNNDAVDAGDIGAGHSVTAIYEITPVGSDSAVFSDTRYGEKHPSREKSDEYGYLKLRYKLPNEDSSRLISQPIGTQSQSTPEVLREARFATAVAGFAQLLQGSKHVGNWHYTDAVKLAQSNRGDDAFGYRAEFIQLIRKAEVANAM